VLRKQAHDRERGHRLAGAGLADDAERASGASANDTPRTAGTGPLRLANVTQIAHVARRGPRPDARRGRHRALRRLSSGRARRAARRSASSKHSRSSSAAGSKNIHGEQRAAAGADQHAERRRAVRCRSKNDKPVSAAA
jgi:hypothetical protein